MSGIFLLTDDTAIIHNQSYSLDHSSAIDFECRSDIVTLVYLQSYFKERKKKTIQ